MRTSAKLTRQHLTEINKPWHLLIDPNLHEDNFLLNPSKMLTKTVGPGAFKEPPPERKLPPQRRAPQDLGHFKMDDASTCAPLPPSPANPVTPKAPAPSSHQASPNYLTDPSALLCHAFKKSPCDIPCPPPRIPATDLGVYHSFEAKATGYDVKNARVDSRPEASGKAGTENSTQPFLPAMTSVSESSPITSSETRHEAVPGFGIINSAVSSMFVGRPSDAGVGLAAAARRAD